MTSLDPSLPFRPRIASGSLEALKWLAVFLMTLDHVNLHLLQGTVPVMFELGRICMPLFAFVLAYNLAQPAAQESGSTRRVLERIAPVALIASLPYLQLNLASIGFFPLNILFTLGSGVGVVLLLERCTPWRLIAAFGLFATAGAFVEYGWIGVGMFATAWHWFRTGSALAFVSTLALVAALGPVYNGNQWALLSVPIFAAAGYVNVPVPRLRSALYVYYPAHLVVLAALQIVVVAR